MAAQGNAPQPRSWALVVERVALPVTAIVAVAAVAFMLEISYGEGDVQRLGLFAAAAIWTGIWVIRSRLKRLESRPTETEPKKESAQVPTTPVDTNRAKLRYTPLAQSVLDSRGASPALSALQDSSRKSVVGPLSASKTPQASAVRAFPSIRSATGQDSRDFGAGSAKRVTFGSATRQAGADDSIYNSPEHIVRQQARSTPQQRQQSGAKGTTPSQAEVPSTPQETGPQQSQQIVKRAQNPLLDVNEGEARALIAELLRYESNKDIMDTWVGNLRSALHELLTNALNTELEKTQGDLNSYLAQISNYLPGLSGGMERKELNLSSQARTAQSTTFARLVTVRRTKKSAPFPVAYVIRRIRSLTEGGRDLVAFDWNGGERFQGSDWTSDQYPTDAEIIMNAFCCWMDSAVKHERSFADAYIQDVTEGVSAETLKSQDWFGLLNCGCTVSPDELSSGGTLAPFRLPLERTPGTLQRTYRPHWKVVFRGEVLEVRERRSNVFHAIILFLSKLNAATSINKPEGVLRHVFNKNTSSDRLIRDEDSRYSSHDLFL